MKSRGRLRPEGAGRSRRAAPDSVHQPAGNSAHPWVDLANLGDAVYLGDDLAAGLICRHGQFDRAVVESLAVVIEVAALVGRARLDEGDVDRQPGIVDHLFAFEFDQAAEVFLGGSIDLAATLPGVDEGADSDRGSKPLATGSRGAQQLDEASHRKIVGGCAVRSDDDVELVRRGAAETRGDHPGHQSFPGEPVQTAIGAALAAAPPFDHCNGHHGEAARGTGPDEAIGDRLDQRFGNDPVASPRNTKGRAIRHQFRRFLPANNPHRILRSTHHV
jgi:hypothetical protein